VNSSSDSLSIFAASSGDPTGAFRETVREGIRMVLKERKLGDPRTDSGCKEFDRSMVMGDDTVVIDAADGRRAICIQKPSKPNPSDRGRRATK
jgi:hypothetical protein